MRKIGMLGLWILSAAAAGAQTLEERVQVLEKHLEGGDGEAPDPGSPAAQALSKKIEVFFSEGLKFRSGDSNFEAHIGGRVIFHGRFFNSENERGKRDTFGFRQVKLNMQGRIWQDWTFKVELSTTGTPVALDDGYVGFEKWTWLKLWAGQFKAPQSLEELTSTRFIDLPERSCQLHPSQVLKGTTRGTVELTLSLAATEEVERFVLGWGEHAEVLAPEALRAKVQARLRAALARYA